MAVIIKGQTSIGYVKNIYATFTSATTTQVFTSSTVGAVTLAVQLSDPNGETLNFANTSVTFYNAVTGNVITGGSNIGVNSSGIASTTVNLSGGATIVREQTYLIRAVITKRYTNKRQVFPATTWTSTNFDAYTVVTVIRTPSPTTNWIQGSGSYSNNAASGTITNASSIGNNWYGFSTDGTTGLNAGSIELFMPRADGIYYLRSSSTSTLTGTGSGRTVTAIGQLTKITSNGSSTSQSSVAPNVATTLQVKDAADADQVQFSITKTNSGVTTNYYLDNSLITISDPVNNQNGVKIY